VCVRVHLFENELISIIRKINLIKYEKYFNQLIENKFKKKEKFCIHLFICDQIE
jgi:hypothetical protein